MDDNIDNIPSLDEDDVKDAVIAAICDVVEKDPSITPELIASGISDAQLQELCITRDQFLAAAEGVVEGMGSG